MLCIRLITVPKGEKISYNWDHTKRQGDKGEEKVTVIWRPPEGSPRHREESAEGLRQGRARGGKKSRGTIRNTFRGF